MPPKNEHQGALYSKRHAREAFGICFDSYSRGTVHLVYRYDETKKKFIVEFI